MITGVAIRVSAPGEPEIEFTLGRLRRVRGVYQVLRRGQCEVTAHRSRCGLTPVGSAVHRAHNLDGAVAFEDQSDERSPCDELAQRWVEVPLNMLGIVGVGQRSVDGAMVEGDDAQSLALVTAEDLSDESSLDRIGLDENERALGHDRGTPSGHRGQDMALTLSDVGVYHRPSID